MAPGLVPQDESGAPARDYDVLKLHHGLADHFLGELQDAVARNSDLIG
jgi:hypothetical protein